MVWIYGGGFTTGSKVGSGNPAGLIARSQDDGQEGVIYVAMNYRLGLFVSFPWMLTALSMTDSSGVDVGSYFPRKWRRKCWLL